MVGNNATAARRNRRCCDGVTRPPATSERSCFQPINSATINPNKIAPVSAFIVHGGASQAGKTIAATCNTSQAATAYPTAVRYRCRSLNSFSENCIRKSQPRFSAFGLCAQAHTELKQIRQQLRPALCAESLSPKQVQSVRNTR